MQVKFYSLFLFKVKVIFPKEKIIGETTLKHKDTKKNSEHAKHLLKDIELEFTLVCTYKGT